MLQAKMNGKDGRDFLVLGLSEGNLKRLREGLPLHLQKEKTGVSADIVIFWGETEAQMYKDFKGFIGPETEVSISLKTGIKHEN